jgi:hypothetical protein
VPPFRRISWDHGLWAMGERHGGSVTGPILYPFPRRIISPWSTTAASSVATSAIVSSFSVKTAVAPVCRSVTVLSTEIGEARRSRRQKNSGHAEYMYPGSSKPPRHNKVDAHIHRRLDVCHRHHQPPSRLAAGQSAQIINPGDWNFCWLRDFDALVPGVITVQTGDIYSCAL